MTGTILLVNDNGLLPDLIEKFQSIEDGESARFHHSGILFQSRHGIYVVEMAPVKGRHTKAACRVKDLSFYTERVKDGLELLFLVPKFKFDEQAFERLLLDYAGTPYGYGKLFFNIPRSILANKVTGKDAYYGSKGEKAKKRPVCMTFSQMVWQEFDAEVGWIADEFDGIFPKWYAGRVSDMYHSPFFEHHKLLPPYDTL